MNHPTDPMTPVRALIEAAGKATPGEWYWERCRMYSRANFQGYDDERPELHCDTAIIETDGGVYGPKPDDKEFIAAARNATASISQLLSEHDKVVALEKELRETPVHMGSVNIRVRKQCADALAAIVEGK